MKTEIQFVEHGKVFYDKDVSDFQILDRSSEKILDIAGRQQLREFMDILRFPSPPHKSLFAKITPNHALVFLNLDKDHYLFVQIQRRKEGEYAESIGNTPRINRLYNQIRFSLVEKSLADYCFLSGNRLFSDLLYKNSDEKILGNHPNALRDYIKKGDKTVGNTVGPLLIDVKEQRQEIVETLQENPNLKFLVNTLIENAKQTKRNQRLSIHLPDLDWKEQLELIEIAQILVFPLVGYFTFSIGDVTENKVDLVLIEKDQISEVKGISEQEFQEQYHNDYFAAVLDLHRKYGDQFTKGEFIENLRNYFLQGMTIEQAGWLAEFSTLRDDRLTDLAPPPFRGGIKELLLLLDRANIRPEFLQKLIPMAFAGDDTDLIKIFLFFYHKGMFNSLIEKIKPSALSADYKIKSYDAYLLVLELGYYFSGDLFEERFFKTYQSCINRKLPILHSGIVSAVTVFDNYKFSEYGIRWSQEVLMNEDERNALVRADLHDTFLNKIQRHYTKSVIPLDPKTEAVHIHFGHALLDENFISILRDCLDGGLSLWNSVLISAVVTNNTRDLTNDQISSLKDILKSESTLGIIKRLGLLEIFREKLRRLVMQPEPDVAAANPRPKPIAAVSLLGTTWAQKGKAENLRISLISAWNEKTSLEELSHALIQEGFRELETKSLYSQMDWLSGISNFHQWADVIVVVLSRQSDSEMWHLLEEIVELASKRNSLTIIARTEDFQPRLRLRNWYQIDLFEPSDYNLLVQQIIQKYKGTDERPEAAPPPKAAAPPPIIGRIGMFLTIISIVVALMICSISLLKDSTTSQPVVTPLQPIILSPFWLGAITLLKGVFVAILFTVIPMWAAKITEYKSRVSQSITEILMFSIVLSSIAFFMFKLQGDGTWMFLAIAIAAILDGGGHLLDYLRENQIDQIRREIRSKQKSLSAKMKSSRKAVQLEKEISQYKVMENYLYRFDQVFQRERILYISLPLGILSGVFLGIYNGAETYEYLRYSILFISLFTMLILGYFVVELLVRMINPVYAGEYDHDDLMVFDSSDLEKSREEKESVLGFAKTTTEIRSMYLYDSAHNIFLLVSFAYIFFSSINYVLPLKWVVLIALVSLVLLNQVPFAIGQSLLRKYILKKYGSYASGIMKSELKKDEFAPLMIKPEFFTSLFTVGAGGLLIALAENFIKELFK